MSFLFLRRAAMPARGGVEHACTKQRHERRGHHKPSHTRSESLAGNLHVVDLFSDFASMLRTRLQHFLARRNSLTRQRLPGGAPVGGLVCAIGGRHGGLMIVRGKNRAKIVLSRRRNFLPVLSS